MELTSDAKFKGKLACGFKYDMKDLVNFPPTTQKSESVTSIGYFCPKYMRIELKKYRGVFFHYNEQWYKIRINAALVVSKMGWGIWLTFIRALKSLKNCTLMGSFCRNNTMFQLENSEELYVMILKGDAKFKGNWHVAWKIRDFINFHATSQKPENLHFDRILLPKVYKDLDEKIQKGYVSWHWRVMQSLKKNWLFVPRMTWGIWWLFTQPLKSLKISLWWAIFVQSIWGLS